MRERDKERQKLEKKAYKKVYENLTLPLYYNMKFINVKNFPLFIATLTLQYINWF